MYKSDKHIETDILINGAGPSGLMTACMLAVHQIPFRIIDKKIKRESYSGAMIIHARTLEIFHQLGISLRFLKEGVIARRINFQFNYRKHFSVDIADFGNGSSLFPYFFILEQTKTENILRSFLSEKGYIVEEGKQLLSFSQKNGTVTSVLKKPDGLSEYVNSKFLIGAGGSTSVVRRQLRIPFIGRTYPDLLFVNDSDADMPALQAEMLFLLTRKHTMGFFPLPGNRWRIDGAIPDIGNSNERINFENIDQYIHQNQDLNIRLFNPTWFSVFRSHSRIAPAYKHHRCFLVGDAAHIHSPVGAQGMNTGLQDAANLAWKLAFFLKGFARSNILETYQEERLPVALKIIRNTDRVYRLITSRNRALKFFRLHILPLLLHLFIFLIEKVKPIRGFLFSSISGIGVSYRNSSLTANIFKKSILFPMPKPGERLPCFQFFIGMVTFNFQEKIRYTVYNLVVFGTKSLNADLQQVIDQFPGMIEVIFIPEDPGTDEIYKHMARFGFALYLVRPDMYIAWRSDSPDALGLKRYLVKFLIPVHEIPKS